MIIVCSQLYYDVLYKINNYKNIYHITPHEADIMVNTTENANFIWNITDLLRGDYKQADYGKVILPLTVLRRLDCVLEPTKQNVPDFLPKIDETKTKVGYEINFTKEFYTYQPLRSLSQIRADIMALENELEGSLREILG